MTFERGWYREDGTELMADNLPLFHYGRSSAVIDDPDGAIRRGAESGQFDTRNPHVANSPALMAALESHGRLPVAGSRGGMSTTQIVIGVIGLALLIGGVALCLIPGPALFAGLILGAIGLLLVVVDVISFQRRRANLTMISQAFNNGWLSYAPARVGGVWISSARQHSSHNNDREDHVRNNDVRFRYRALVEVFPTDGSEPFRFTSGEFSAPASHRGVPLDLKMMDGPLDHGEPEFNNGWTVARWVSGNQESATISTDLAKAQIRAALNAVGPRPGM